jgi:lysophospholipid acyltransferase (LPLAT)-like uncharacterized protein
LAGYAHCPIVPFHIEGIRTKVLSSWDQFQIPWPLSRVRIDIGEPIWVAAGAGEAALEAHRLALQAALVKLQKDGRAWAVRSRKIHGPAA